MAENRKLISSSLVDYVSNMNLSVGENPHDCEIRRDSGWIIDIGSGFDTYRKLDNWFSVVATELRLCPCLRTRADLFRRSWDRAEAHAAHPDPGPPTAWRPHRG